MIHLNTSLMVWLSGIHHRHVALPLCGIRGLTLGYLRACEEWEQMVVFICSFYKCILSRFFLHEYFIYDRVLLSYIKSKYITSEV